MIYLAQGVLSMPYMALLSEILMVAHPDVVYLKGQLGTKKHGGHRGIALM